MKNDLFIVELIKSFPFKIFVILVLLIVLGVTTSKCKEKRVQMKEDVLNVQPKPKV